MVDDYGFDFPGGFAHIVAENDTEYRDTGAKPTLMSSSFEDLGLSPDLLRAVDDAGYKDPTPIQEQAIPYVLMGRDLLGCAQTGTGKTAGFTLPMIDILASGRTRARMPRSLIVTPTRELATQISESFEVYGKYHKLTMALLIGGVSFVEQNAKLDRGVDVLIATPGRLLDHFERGRILLNDIKILVVDEADRMTDMGFMPDVTRIVSLLPKIRQTLFFSATLPPEIRQVADGFLINPKEISVTPESAAAETVIQSLAIVREGEKGDALRAIIRNEDVTNALIFCNRKRDVDALHRSLKRHKLSVAALHGDMPQPARLEVLETFKRGDVTLLVASDVAARGLDLPRVSHVFNYDVPINPEDYIHRIGRTGRAGRSGKSFTLAMPDEALAVEAIVRLIGNEIPRIEVPGIGATDLEPADRKRRPRRRGGNGRKMPDSPPAAKADSAGNEAKNPRRRRRKESDSPAPERTDNRQAANRQPPPAAAKQASPRVRKPAEKKSGDGGDGPVLGLGSHVPAFMQQPPKSAKT